jgi:hypothetical protein
MAEIPEENVEVNGKTIGTSSTIKLSVKTALWILSGICSVVIFILSYSYFDLKSKNEEFVKSVNDKVEKIQDDVTNIRIGQEEVKGDIKLILDRQNRDNPVYTTDVQVKSNTPPSMPNIVK